MFILQERYVDEWLEILGHGGEGLGSNLNPSASPAINVYLFVSPDRKA